MKITLAVFVCFYAAASALAATPLRIDVPSDPQASYTVIEVKKIGRRMVEVTTKRERRSAMSYAKRLVDCSSGTFKYLGDGDTLEAMRQSRPSPNMGPLVQGSISFYISTYACGTDAKIANMSLPPSLVAIPEHFIHS